MTDSEKLITNLILEAAAEKPLLKRAAYYRALASLTTDDRAVENFIYMAEALEACEIRCRQMQEDFRSRVLHEEIAE